MRPPEPVVEPGSYDDTSDRWHPLEAHTPQTVSEAGLELPPSPTGRWRIVALVVLAVVALAVLFVALQSDGDRASVLDVDLGACVTRAVTDVDAPVEEVACDAGAVRVVVRETHPAGLDELHPGDGALALFGQGACQGRVDPDRLVVAVPSPTSWAAGERAVACLEQL
jgi:hypothetical protein